MPRSRIPRPRLIAGALATAALVLWLPSPAQALTTTPDGSDRVIVEIPATPNAAQLWIDVEDPALDGTNTVVTIATSDVSVHPTPFGVTAIIDFTGEPASAAVVTAVDASPDIAVTIVDADGVVLFEDHVRVALTAAPAPTETPTPPPTHPVPPGDSPAPAGNLPGSLGATGIELPLALMLGAALLIATGGTMAITRRKRS